MSNQNTSEKIVWVVEDDPFFSSWISRKIHAETSYEVRAFPDGESMLAESSEWPHLVVLDYNLHPDGEGLSGLDTLRRLRQFHPELPILVVSGQDDVDTAVKLVRAGAWEYVVKGKRSTGDDIVSSVKNLVNLVQSQKTLDTIRVKKQKEKLRLGVTVMIILAIVTAALVWG